MQTVQYPREVPLHLFLQHWAGGYQHHLRGALPVALQPVQQFQTPCLVHRAWDGRDGVGHKGQRPAIHRGQRSRCPHGSV